MKRLDNANISTESKDALKQMLENLAEGGFLEAEAYNKIAKLRF